MKKSRITALVLCIITALTVFSSCGSSNKITNSYLLDIIETGILGKSQAEILALDKYTAEFKVNEKDMDDGTHRVKYTYVDMNPHGDAFVSGGKWFTTVNYFFDQDSLVTYRIEYRQSDYSQGMCAKRMTMFSEYLTEKFGEPVKEYCWEIAGGVLEMKKQNGGWILFVYEAIE